jgi:radical SAM protein with 4Fe4S-binding SPASM domain
MSFITFKKVIDKMPQLNRILLFNWGEPFLNPDLFEMIRYAKKHSIYVQIDSNFSLKKQLDFFASIIESGLDLLTIALDGASQFTYSKYRKGGNFNTVINNIKTLMNLKKKLKSKNPEIIWKFIVNRFNEREIFKALKKSLYLGVKFRLQPIGLGDDLPDIEFGQNINKRMKNWLPKNKKYIQPHYRNTNKKPFNNIPCPHLFFGTIINPDGKVFPCCYATDKQNVFGDLMTDSFASIWNNDKYGFSRSLFMKGRYVGPKIETICASCENYKKIKK